MSPDYIRAHRAGNAACIQLFHAGDFAPMAPEEDAEIHPSTGYIPWSDAKQACVNAEESYRGDVPDADCARVRGHKGGSCHSEFPVSLSSRHSRLPISGR